MCTLQQQQLILKAYGISISEQQGKQLEKCFKTE